MLTSMTIVACACSYADTYVRTVALNAIRQLSSDELLDYLPQLVQVSVLGVRERMRYEWRREGGMTGLVSVTCLLVGCIAESVSLGYAT